MRDARTFSSKVSTETTSSQYDQAEHSRERKECDGSLGHKQTCSIDIRLPVETAIDSTVA